MARPLPARLPGCNPHVFLWAVIPTYGGGRRLPDSHRRDPPGSFLALLEMGSRRVLGLRGIVTRLAAGRGTSNPPEEEMSEEEAVERMLRRQQKAAHERRIRRMMEPPGPPERTLTRQAMEQIRYLSRELPAEWPVARLAQGFQVSPEVVLRVLRSRFVPSPECAKKQDARVQGRPRSPSRVETLPSPGTPCLALLAAPTSSAVTLSRPSTPLPAVSVKQPEEGQGRRAPGRQKEIDAEPETALSLEEVEELAAQGWHQHNPAWVPMQRGWAFFDPEGNLVFKVPEGLLEAGKDQK